MFYLKVSKCICIGHLVMLRFSDGVSCCGPAPGLTWMAYCDSTAIKTNDIIDSKILVLVHKCTWHICELSHINNFRPGLRCGHLLNNNTTPSALATTHTPIHLVVAHQKGRQCFSAASCLHQPDRNIRGVILRLFLWQCQFISCLFGGTCRFCAQLTSPQIIVCPDTIIQQSFLSSSLGGL